MTEWRSKKYRSGKIARFPIDRATPTTTAASTRMYRTACWGCADRTKCETCDKMKKTSLVTQQLWTPEENRALDELIKNSYSEDTALRAKSRAKLRITEPIIWEELGFGTVSEQAKLAYVDGKLVTMGVLPAPRPEVAYKRVPEKAILEKAEEAIAEEREKARREFEVAKRMTYGEAKKIYEAAREKVRKYKEERAAMREETEHFAEIATQEILAEQEEEKKRKEEEAAKELERAVKRRPTKGEKKAYEELARAAGR